jgi:hypothetical protein
MMNCDRERQRLAISIPNLPSLFSPIFAAHQKSDSGNFRNENLNPKTLHAS